jgi:opacity protein-like surface antigen
MAPGSGLWCGAMTGSGWVGAGGVLAVLLGAGLPATAQGLMDEPGSVWSGFHIGLHAGGALSAVSVGQGQHSLGPLSLPGQSLNVDNWGGAVGLTVGYGRAFGPLVAGLEGDIGWLALNDRFTVALGADNRLDMTGGLYGTVRGRLGLALDRLMVFGTAGVVLADMTGTYTDTTTGDRVSANDLKHGLAWGGGLEVALTRNWSVKGEYLRLNLADEAAVAIVNAQRLDFSFGMPLHMLRFGANARF